MHLIDGVANFFHDTIVLLFHVDRHVLRLPVHHFNLPNLALKVISELVKVVLSGLNHALVVFDFLMQLTNLVVLLLALVSNLEQRIVELNLTLVESLPHFFEHVHAFADGAERELVFLLETFQFFDFSM